MNRIGRDGTEDDWAAYGLCVSEDPKLWDGVRMTRSRTGPLDFSVARGICSECKVSNLCLGRALQTGDTGCMRGGKDPAELKVLLDEHGKPKIERARVMA